MVFSNKPEHRYAPVGKFTEEDKTLKGFIWKPKDRPVSKESILPSYNKKTTSKTGKGKAPAKGKGKVKAPVKDSPDKNQPAAKRDTGIVKKDTSAVKLNGAIKLLDSLKKTQPAKTQDTAKKGKDTTAVKNPATTQK
jgi:hypothetical protein